MTFKTDSEKFQEMLDQDAAARKAFLEQWNADNKPVEELYDADPTWAETLGVFNIDGSWCWGYRYANGYHPEKLVYIPEKALGIILRNHRILSAPATPTDHLLEP